MENPLNAIKPAASGKAGAFARGFGSGAMSSGMMLGIFSVVGLAFGLSPLGWAAAGATVLTTGLFSGFMGARKAAAEPAPVHAHTKTNTPAKTREGHGHAVALEQEVDAPAPRTNWADRVSGQGTTKDRIAQIRANGPSASQTETILTAREASPQSHSIG